MRKIIFILLTLTLALTTACNKEEEGLVRIALLGTGTAVINWGDGTANAMVTLTDLITRLRHTYIGSTVRTITITGDNVTQLFCGYDPETMAVFDNQLTVLDVSKNPALTLLRIISNLFEDEKDEKGLNPLFRTLHGNGEGKIIRINDNPGAAACDPSIAEVKGWVVYR